MDPDRPLVSVVIPTRNRAERVGDAVRSVVAQSYADVEVIVVDDGSEDRTPELLDDLADLHGIQCVRTATPGGAARARNLGVERARGELVAFLDDDCRWDPSKLEKQVGRLDAEHGVAYCIQAVREVDGEGWIVEGRPPPNDGIRSALLRANFIGTSTVLVRRSMFLDAGGFNERMDRLQDWELLLRLSLHTGFGYVDEVLVTGEMVHGGISSDRPALLSSAQQLMAEHGPDLSKAERSELLYGLGKYLLADGLTREPRAFFMASLRLNPLNPIGLLGLAASLLGPEFARTVRAWRRRVAARSVGPGPHRPKDSATSGPRDDVIRRIFQAMASFASKFGVADLGYRLLGVARRIRSPGVLVENMRIRSEGAPDGLPVPPDRLLHLVGGFNSVRRFLETGAAAAASIRDILGADGRTVSEFDSVLDFGCGCGRVLRRWHGVEGPHFHGCDYNARLVRWVDENLSTVTARVNGPAPPLPYAAASFDFVYALSVFTHLTETSQQAWLADLRRVLRPNGLLLVTVHGEGFAHLLTDLERERFMAGELVVTNPEAEGTNVCAAYHPVAYMRERFAAGFEIVSAQPGGARGNGGQDQYLLRVTDT